MSEERKITTITGFLSRPLEIDVDRSWRNLIAEPFDRQLEIIGDEYHWAIHLPWIGLTEAQQETFWNAFYTPEATRARKTAIHGVRRANYEAERDFLNQAYDLAERRREAIEAGENNGEKMDGQWDEMALLGLRLCEIVSARDHKQLGRMTAILEHGKTPVSAKPRGGEEALLGQMFRNFCQLHLTSRTLPTKKQLREECGMDGGNPDIKKASKMMKELGLDGLPKSSSRTEK